MAVRSNQKIYGRPFYATDKEVSHGRQDPEQATQAEEAEAAEDSVRLALLPGL
jgi:hypothetical protein